MIGIVESLRLDVRRSSDRIDPLLPSQNPTTLYEFDYCSTNFKPSSKRVGFAGASLDR
jgi:hypothetical protein